MHMKIPRIGHGYDVHRLTEGRKLILGGVDIPYEKGLLGHSDADVLAHAISDALASGYQIGNIDSTILAQAPKLAPHIAAMRENIAKACGIDVLQISVKATTEEKLGFTGSGEGMAAHAVALIY